MKKIKPNLRKMFDFHTIAVLVVTLILLRSCTTTQGRVQHHHSHNQNHHNHHQHHQRHLHNDNDDKLLNNHYPHTTPRIVVESTTNNPLPLPVVMVVDSDNELTISEDESNNQNSQTSTTSTPSQPLHHHRDGQHFNLNSSSLSSSPTASFASYSNFIVEHHQHQRTHHQAERPQYESTRLVPTPLPPLPSYFLSATATTAATSTVQQYNNHPGNGGDHQSRPSSFMAAKATNPSEHSKYSNHAAAADAAIVRDNYKYQLRTSQRPQHHHPSQRQQHHPHQQQKYVDYDDYDLQQQEKQNHLKTEEDYYEEYNDEDEDDDEDIDGFIDDTDNNLSDRSYARITRSKLDDDYADDEPYHNAVEDQMQRDAAAPGVLTDQKYLEVGNEKSVQQARERYIQEQKRQRTPHELATEHWQRMVAATKCRKPLPRVIPVSNNTSKRYEPYATILHRCGEDTGCCGSTASVCTVKRYETVMVYVFSYDFNYRKEIEALQMHNHTECHCVNRGSLQYESTPRGKRSGSWQHHLQPQQQFQRPQQQYHHHQQQPQQQQQHQRLVRRSDMKTPPQSQPQTQPHHSENMLSCHCPRHFSVLEEDVERYAHLPRPHTVLTRKCRCDCLPNNQTCLRFKHGEEGFSLEDRKCIMEHNCKPPVCSLGDYNIQSGRCPSYRSHGRIEDIK